MYFSKSRDGLLRASVNCQFRIGHRDLLVIIQYLLFCNSKFYKPTRKQVINEMREQIESYGNYWWDHVRGEMDFTSEEDVPSGSDKIFYELFPEFRKKDLNAH